MVAEVASEGTAVKRPSLAAQHLGALGVLLIMPIPIGHQPSIW